MKARSQRIFLVAAGLLAACAFHPLLLWDPGLDYFDPLEGWFFLPTNTSPKVVFALGAAVAYRRRERIRQALRGRASPAAAVPALFAGFAVYLWAAHTGATDLLLVSLVLVGLGACLLYAGTGLAGALTFPLLILLFAIPLPATLTNELFYVLQVSTARDAANLLPLVGMPVSREGNTIYSAHGHFQVIDTCTGLRFIEVLALLAMVLAGWFPAGWVRTLLRLALAVPIAYVFNLLRVCLLILHPSSPLSSMHVVQGWAVFFGAVCCLAYIDARLLRRLPEHPRGAPEILPREPLPGAEDRSARRWAAVLPGLLAGMLAAWFWVPRWELPAQERFVPVGLPVEIDGWRVRSDLPLNDRYLGTVRFTAHFQRPFARGREAIVVLVGYDNRTRRAQSFLTPKNAFLDAGWQVEDRSFLSPEGRGAAVESVLARSWQRRALSHTWYTNTGGLWEETFRTFLALDQSVLRRPGAGRIIRLSTLVGPEPGAVAVARDRLRAFAPALEAALQAAAARRAIPQSGSAAETLQESY